MEAVNAEKTAVSQADGSQSGSFFDCDADLARLIAAWPKPNKGDQQFLAGWPSLSAAKRKSLVAMLAALKE